MEMPDYWCAQETELLNNVAAEIFAPTQYFICFRLATPRWINIDVLLIYFSSAATQRFKKKDQSTTMVEKMKLFFIHNTSTLVKKIKL